MTFGARSQRRSPIVRELTILTLIGAMLGCGSSTSPVQPSPMPSPSPSPAPSPFTLTIVSGEAGAPIAGATVTVVDRSYTTNQFGEVGLPESPDTGSLLAIAAAGYLNRQTLLRSASERQFSLWPQTSATGLTEQLTQELVYTVPGNGPGGVGSPLGGAPLQRVDPGVTQMVVSAPSVTLAPSGIEAIKTAIRNLNDATGGQIVFTSSPVSGAGQIEIIVGTPSGPPRTLNSSGYITGGRIFLRDGTCLTTNCNLAVPLPVGVTFVRTLVHAMGGLLGLNATSSDSVMNGGCSSSSLSSCTPVNPYGETFKPAEKLIIRLMFQRRIGNRFPDNDRNSP